MLIVFRPVWCLRANLMFPLQLWLCGSPCQSPNRHSPLPLWLWAAPNQSPNRFRVALNMLRVQEALDDLDDEDEAQEVGGPGDQEEQEILAEQELEIAAAEVDDSDGLNT